jgi:hypothetical protein
VLRGLITYTHDERRATLAGVNLFFSALLGANLGALSNIPLSDYFRLVLLLVGAVTAILTIAVSRRRVTVISTATALAVVLATISLVPGAGGARLGDDLDRMAVTLAVWLVMLMLVRLTPSDGSPVKPTENPADDEIDLPPH